MNVIQEAEKLLSGMTRAEKAQMLQWIVQDLGGAFPGIDSLPEVCGGEPCIVRTPIIFHMQHIPFVSTLWR